MTKIARVNGRLRFEWETVVSLLTKGPMLETLDFTIRIVSTPTFLYTYHQPIFRFRFKCVCGVGEVGMWGTECCVKRIVYCYDNIINIVLYNDDNTMRRRMLYFSAGCNKQAWPTIYRTKHESCNIFIFRKFSKQLWLAIWEKEIRNIKTTFSDMSVLHIPPRTFFKSFIYKERWNSRL